MLDKPWVAVAFLAVAFAACATENRPGAASGTAPDPQPAHTADSPGASSGATEAAPPVVGGACEYAKFPGSCTVTSAGHPPTFTFEGPVAGQNVKLEGNEVDPSARESFPKGEPGASQPCTLEFLTKGTCTPCMLSVGSCGQAAWALFRSQPR